MKQITSSLIRELYSTLIHRLLPHPRFSYVSAVSLVGGAVFLSSPFNATAKTTSQSVPSEYFYQPVTVTTKSLFTDQFFTKNIYLPFSTEEIDDNEIEIGETVVKQEGKNGVKVQTIKVTNYKGEEYEQELVEEKVTLPVKKIIAHGTKIIWRDVDTPQGSQKYWRKFHVWATSYDSTCPGCDETTATGMKAGYGVIAVDPSVIKLYSKVYIPGYGVAVAGDTGGAIKGNKIDLGFDDVRNGWWSSRWTDVYLLD